MLESASMKDLVINKLPGIFTVGWHHKAVFATGHYSTQFKAFLIKHIPGIDVTYCFEEIKELHRPQSLDAVKAVCNENVNELRQKVFVEITSHCNNLPLIVFGLNKDGEFIQKVK